MLVFQARAVLPLEKSLVFTLIAILLQLGRKNEDVREEVHSCGEALVSTKNLLLILLPIFLLLCVVRMHKALGLYPLLNV